MRAKENAFGKNEAEISAQVEVEIVSSPSPHPAHGPWARANTVANVVWLLVFSTKVQNVVITPGRGEYTLNHSGFASDWLLSIMLRPF